MKAKRQLALMLGAAALGLATLVPATPARAQGEDLDELKRDILREVDRRLERTERRILEGVERMLDRHAERFSEERRGDRRMERPGISPRERPEARGPGGRGGGWSKRLGEMARDLEGTEAWKNAMRAYRRAMEEGKDWRRAFGDFEDSLRRDDKWEGPSLKDQFERVERALRGTGDWERALDQYRRAMEEYDGDWQRALERFEKVLRDSLGRRAEEGRERFRDRERGEGERHAREREREQRERDFERERPDRRPERPDRPDRPPEGEGESGGAFLGVSVGGLDDVDPQYREQVKSGVLIVEAIEGGSAAKAGLKQGDVIQAINGDEITDFEQLAAAIRRRRPGDVIRVRVFREGWAKDVEVRLGARPTEDR